MITVFKSFINEYFHSNKDAAYYNTINSDKFKDRFKESVMIDGEGEPIIFYHGSNNDFNEFDKNKIGTSTDNGWLGWGFYFYMDEHEASQYGKVKRYLLCIEEPYYITNDEHERLVELDNEEASKEFTNNLIMNGYDGIHYNGNLRGETVVFEPSQIIEIK